MHYSVGNGVRLLEIIEKVKHRIFARLQLCYDCLCARVCMRMHVHACECACTHACACMCVNTCACVHLQACLRESIRA